MSSNLTAYSLHNHFGLQLWNEAGLLVPPHELAEKRRGSNCSPAPLDQFITYLKSRNVEFFGFSNHIREADGPQVKEGILNAFMIEMHRHPEWWRYANIDRVSLKSFDDADHLRLYQYCSQAADAVAHYDDRRIIQTWHDITQAHDTYHLEPNTLLRAAECNTLPDGSMDAYSMRQARCQYWILSIHPNIDPVGFEQIRSDPVLYGRFAQEVLNRHPDALIFAHPGYKCSTTVKSGQPDAETNFRFRLGLPFADTLIKHNIALEINLSRAWHQAAQTFLDPAKYPSGTTQWLDEFKSGLKCDTPYLSDSRLMPQLSQFTARGGLISINIDAPQVPRGDAVPARHMYMVETMEDFVSQTCADYHIFPESIINLWPKERVLELTRHKQKLGYNLPSK